MTVPAISTASLVAAATKLPIAENTSDACHQMLTLFAGVYGDKFKPNSASVAIWSWLLEGISPDTILDAAVEHIRDTTQRKDGSRAGSWPPSPADILGPINDRRKARQEAASHSYNGTRYGSRGVGP